MSTAEKNPSNLLPSADATVKPDKQARPKRPAINSVVRSDELNASIAYRRGRRRDWITRIFWDGNVWLAHSNPSEVALGEDMICYLDRQPRSPTEVVLVKKVFATFCVGEVMTVN